MGSIGLWDSLVKKISSPLYSKPLFMVSLWRCFPCERTCLRMLEDSKAQDDPKLGRYLFIGDSISGNYDKALRTALKGKLNIYHPPTNCGPVRKGVENIAQWLGAYDQPGLGWDVISFNFGQWDSGNTKSRYQEYL